MKRILLAVLAWLAFCGYEVAHAQSGGGFPPQTPPLAIKCINNASGCNIAGLKVGQGACAVNDGTTPTTRTVTTQSDDAYLRLTNVPIGYYVEFASFQFGTSSTGGINFTNSFGWNSSSASNMAGTVNSGVNSPTTFSTWSYQSCCMATSGWGGTNGFTTSTFAGSASGLGFWHITIGSGSMSLFWGENNAVGTATVYTGEICAFRIG